MAEIGLYALTSLLGAGLLLNQSKQARPQLAGSGLPHNDKTVGTDVYNSQEYFKVKQEEFTRATRNFTDARNPKVTGVIPMYYNTLHAKGDYEKLPNASYESDMIYGVLSYLDRETQAKIRASSIHDREGAPTQEWGILMDRPLPSALKEGEDPLKQIGGSLIPGQEDFTHNNMVPFYKSTITQDTRSDSQGKDMKLEIYTGQFKLNQEQKKEVETMFKPMPENIYGTQISRDLSRLNPSNTGKKHNESPIEQIQVGPGLGHGYTNLPSGGRHETLRIMPRSIEELRVDPVLETEAKTTSGGSRISKRTLISQMYRNRPELLVTNHNGERNFTTTGASIAQMSQPTIILRNTRRKKSRTVQGAAKGAVEGQRVAPKSKVSSRVNFLATPFRNAAGQEERKVNDYGKSSYTAYDNNRMAKISPQTGGSSSSSGSSSGSSETIWGGTQTIMQMLGLAGPTAPTQTVQDKVRKTRKQCYIDNPHSQTGNGMTSGPARAPSYNPQEWVAKKTIRETTENFNHLGGAVEPVKATVVKGGDWTMRKTIRETTEDNKHIGHASGIQKKHIVWEGQRARKTIRETTEDKKHIGHASGIQKKHIVWEGQKARKTIRETTDDNNRKGNVGASSVKRGGGYSTSKWEAKNTSRQFTSDNSYTGGGNAATKKTISYDDAYNARTNENKEVIAQGRAPTDRGPNLGYQTINVEAKKLDEDRVNKYRVMKTSSMGNTFNPEAISPCTVTSDRNHLPQLDTRLDVGILDAFKRNPLTQSLASWF